MADGISFQAAPTVIGKPFRMVAAADFAQKLRNVLIVVGAVNAGHVKVGRPDRLPV